jgi:hypothetical protein
VAEKYLYNQIQSFQYKFIFNVLVITYQDMVDADVEWLLHAKKFHETYEKVVIFDCFYNSRSHKTLQALSNNTH